MARAALPESERVDFYLYVDEFHNLVTETFENLLSEARKYALCLTIAHQFMGQLITRVQQAVLGNTGTTIVFRVGGEDAVKLEPELEPVFGVKDMVNLGVQSFYIKETIDGEAYDPFSAETLKVLPPAHPSFKEQIIKRSREKYTISAEAAKKLMEEEEAKIFRGAREKAIIEGKKGKAATGEPESKEEKDEEPLI